MAADSSFTQTIFFIAAIVVAVSISGVLIGVSASMANELRVKSDATAEKMSTDIELINDPRHVPYADGVLTLYLKNTGEVTLSYNNTVILIDGQYIDYVPVVNDAAGQWSPGKTLQITAQVELGAGDHSAKAVTSNGVSDTMTFRI
jgi:archaellum component FlaG (FlaF/FlaG flagellin family)